MGDRATLEKARKELEELYMGVPDDSVNLTFQDLAEIREKKKTSPKAMEAISESSSSPFARLPSLDFTKALEASYGPYDHHHTNHHGVNRHNHHHHHRLDDEGDIRELRGGHMYVDDDHHHHHRNHHGGGLHGADHGGGFRHSDQRSFVYDDDMSHVSGMSVAYGQERGMGGRRRPGIPHSKICAVCSTYTYIFRHRCLVCGRVYCRQCVSIGMGEMTEGRKCIECLGRKFSQRYIKRAGKLGCCMGYPSTVKQQELKWAEKGPRRGSENPYTHSVAVSRPRSPLTPRTPTRSSQHSPSNPPSFVATSPFSSYSQSNHTHHHLPF